MYDGTMIGYALHYYYFVMQKHLFVRQNGAQKLIMYYRMMIGYACHNKDYVIQKCCCSVMYVILKILSYKNIDLSGNDVQNLIMYDGLMVCYV